MSGTARQRFLISGQVQGVFFRDSTAREAQRLGLTGQAINLADGRVEVWAAGPRERLAELEQWLASGPPLARVERVESESVSPEDWHCGPGFVTG